MRTPRKPFSNRRTAHQRLSGRALQERNNRVKARDLYTCRRCKRVTGPDDGEVDHVIPLSKGGSDDDSNCAWTCKPCHAAKSLEERGAKPRRRVAFDVDGWPLDPSHHWNQEPDRGG